jgi:hypothetical protein
MVQLAASAKIFWSSPPFVIRQMHALQAEMFRFPAAARKNPQAIDPRALAGPQCGGEATPQGGPAQKGGTQRVETGEQSGPSSVPAFRSFNVTSSKSELENCPYIFG